jgi:hypothetical protein
VTYWFILLKRPSTFRQLLHPLIATCNCQSEPSNLQFQVIRLFYFPLPFMKLSDFQMFCAFFVHLFLGFKVYTPMQLLFIIHCASCHAWFLVSTCAFVFFTFPPSLYLYDLVSLLLLGSWLEFSWICACESTWFRVWIYFYLPLCFS